MNDHNPQPGNLTRNDRKRLAREIKQHQGVITPIALSARWDISIHLAAQLINQYSQ